MKHLPNIRTKTKCIFPVGFFLLTFHNFIIYAVTNFFVMQYGCAYNDVDSVWHQFLLGIAGQCTHKLKTQCYV